MKLNQNTLWALLASAGFTHAAPAPVVLSPEDISNIAYGNPPSASLQKRACASNNLLRLFKDSRYSSSAIGFCATYVQNVITATTAIVASITEDTTVTPPPTTVTATEVVTETETETLSTDFYTTNPFDTAALEKRTAIPYPSWLPTTYAASSVSSVCSCFNTVQPPAIYTTVTVVTSTETVDEAITLPPATVTDIETATSLVTVSVGLSTPKALICGGTPGCPSGSVHTTLLASGKFDTLGECFDLCSGVDGALSVQYGLTNAGGFEKWCFCWPIDVASNWNPNNPQSVGCVSYYQFDLECRFLGPFVPPT
ncbi:hypothetical protein H072_11037 [Dactylellina haptotyla CBS 200.50]|uniref:Apple domain-containing protein n=1 Tax=Dactylellina haptotyla (strain CBS 200.50) TaxID=1284197 RepID=S7ZYM3_DACHA|nr:hypothetical protein H072_11037 [Dactylellina haptotyla CBS 200.50]